jgi:hypothetical protein
MLERIRAVLRQFTMTQRLWIALTLIGVYAYFFVFFFPFWHRYERLTHVGALTSGSVIAKEPKNHASVRFEYRVDGTRYEGVMTAGWMDVPPLEEIRIGQPVSVTYWPEHPSVSTLGSARKLSEYWLGPLVGAPLVAGLFLAVGVALSLKRVTSAQLIAYVTKRYNQFRRDSRAGGN